ncbi:MAG: S41 family peptidase [Prevotella sp.]|nr:S41 family peptidase [Prevotella sp.]
MRKILLAALALLTTIGVQAQLRLGDKSPKSKLHMAEMAITNLYVDTVDENKLVEDAIRGMLDKLDPHSTYSTAKEVKAMNESLEGSFEGIGVQFNMMEDSLVVIQTITNGPSEKVGILPGDRIVEVNDTAIAGVKMSKEEIMRRLRGPKGTKANLKIVRPGIKGKQPFTVIRDKIPVYSLDASYMIRPRTGYIRIGNFGATTYDEFMKALNRLQEQGIDDLILDLQDNGGGYLQAAVNVINEFLTKGDMIVYTNGRSTPRHEYRSDGGTTPYRGRVIVLVNEFSASASEIVAGAIQDQDRGFIVGRRSFGKGLVQRPIEFADGSMIRLTIAHYYTPSGRCIQKPYTKGDQKDYAKDLDNRLKNGELTNADSIHFADSLKYQTLREHRTVYGGGGIMPDYFVPLDTTKYTKYHRQLAAKSAIINANLKYIDANRKSLKKRYASFEDFNANYEVPQSFVDSVIANGEASEVKPKDDEELATTLPYLRTQLKALVARDLWDMNEYFQVMNETNDIILKALEVLKK